MVTNVSVLSSQLEDDFQSKGFVVEPGFLNQDQINSFITDVLWLVKETSGVQKLDYTEYESLFLTLSRNLIQIYQHNKEAQSWIYDEINRQPFMHRLSSDERLISYVKRALGSEHVGIHPRLNMIMAMPDEKWHLAGWHQDAYYARANHLTVYLPLQPTSEDNGGLCVVPYGHRMGLLQHKQGLASYANKWLTIPEDVIADLGSEEQVDLQAGDLLLFDGALPHRARYNGSDDVRFVITIRYSNLEDPFFIRRGWKWQDLTEEALKRLSLKEGDLDVG